MNLQYVVVAIFLFLAVFLIALLAKYEYDNREIVCKEVLPFKGYWEAETPNISVNYWHVDTPEKFLIKFKKIEKENPGKIVEYLEIFDKNSMESQQYYITSNGCLKKNGKAKEPYFNPFEIIKCMGKEGFTIKNYSENVSESDLLAPQNCKNFEMVI
jgi:hypothetical protein